MRSLSGSVCRVPIRPYWSGLRSPQAAQILQVAARPAAEQSCLPISRHAKSQRDARYARYALSANGSLQSVLSPRRVHTQPYASTQSTSDSYMRASAVCDSWQGLVPHFCHISDRLTDPEVTCHRLFRASGTRSEWGPAPRGLLSGRNGQPRAPKVQSHAADPRA